MAPPSTRPPIRVLSRGLTKAGGMVLCGACVHDRTVPKGLLACGLWWQTQPCLQSRAMPVSLPGLQRRGGLVSTLHLFTRESSECAYVSIKWQRQLATDSRATLMVVLPTLRIKEGGGPPHRCPLESTPKRSG